MLQKFFALLILSGTVLFAADEEQAVPDKSQALRTFEQSWHPAVKLYYNPSAMPKVGEILALPGERFAQNGSVGIVFDGNGEEGVLHFVCNNHDGSVAQNVFATVPAVESDVPFTLSAADGLVTLSGVYDDRTALDSSASNFDANTGMLKFDAHLGFSFEDFGINSSHVVAVVFFLQGKSKSLTFATFGGKLVVNGSFADKIAIESSCESAALAFKAPVKPQQVVAASADVPSVQLFSQ